MEGPNNPRVTVVVTRQLNLLRAKAPDGVKIIINDSDIFDIQAELEGPVQTPYEGGIFRCKLQLPLDFPKNPPKGYFLTKIFHPNVSEKGEICVNTLKKDWNHQNWSFYNIFEVIKCLLIIPFPESALNEEAGKLFMEDYDAYFKHAKLLTEVHSKPREKEKPKEQVIEKQPSKERSGSSHLLRTSSSGSSLGRGFQVQQFPFMQCSTSQSQQISQQTSMPSHFLPQSSFSSSSPYRESGRQLQFPQTTSLQGQVPINQSVLKNQNQENLQFQGFNNSVNGSFLAQEEPLSVLSKNNGYSFNSNAQSTGNQQNLAQQQLVPSSSAKQINQLQEISLQQSLSSSHNSQSLLQQQQQQQQQSKNKTNVLLHLTFNSFKPSPPQSQFNQSMQSSAGKQQIEKNKWLKRL